MSKTGVGDEHVMQDVGAVAHVGDSQRGQGLELVGGALFGELKLGGFRAKDVVQGEEVGENLGRVPEGAEGVQHRNVGVFREFL